MMLAENMVECALRAARTLKDVVASGAGWMEAKSGVVAVMQQDLGE